MPIACNKHNKQRMITCIFSAETDAQGILRRLKDEKHIFTAGVYHARGVGGSATYRSQMAGGQEKNVISAVVPLARADEIFEFLYEAGELYKPHHGMMYMERLDCTTPLNLPDDLPDLDALVST